VLAALIGGILFATSKLGPTQVTVSVPNVIGKSELDAANMLREQNLIAISKQVNSPKPIGTVTAQNPKPGADVRKNSKVTISVGGGVGTSVIPNVTGFTRADATKKLVAAHFQVKVDPAESSSSVAPGSVIRTMPAAGGQADIGSVVHIVPSKGVAIPNVVNLPSQTAVATLVQAGLAPEVKPEASNTVPTGSVTRTDPPFGTNNVPAGSPITVFVSTGSAKVSVPTVVGFSVSKAQSTLAGANLQTSLLFQSTSQKGNDGKVLDQNPPAGTQVDPQSTVVLTVGEFTAPTTTPTTGGGPTTTGP